MDFKCRDGPFPSAEAIVHWRGQDYMIRRAHRHLFFCAPKAACPPPLTFVISTPLAESTEATESELAQFFSHEMEVGNFARYFCICGYDRWFPILANLDGIGFCREYWNEASLVFKHSIARIDLLIEPDSVLGPAIQKCLIEEIEPLLAQEYNFGEAPLKWLCGSKETLQEVLGWICSLESAFWGEAVKIEISTECIPYPAQVTGIECGALTGYRGRGGSSIHWSRERQLCDATESLPGSRFLSLLELALDDNTPIGHEWEYRDEGSGITSHYPRGIDVVFLIAAQAPEQRVEAHAKLQVWLENKVTLAEANTLLK